MFLILLLYFLVLGARFEPAPSGHERRHIDMLCRSPSKKLCKLLVRVTLVAVSSHGNLDVDGLPYFDAKV